MFIGQMFPSAFQGNISQIGNHMRKAPVNDILNRISNHIISNQKQLTDFESSQKLQEIKKDSYIGGTNFDEDTSLKEMPDEMLHVLRNLFLVQRNLSHAAENELIAFRDGLSAFDQTIEEYQGMLNGELAMPNELTMEDVTKLLETTQTAREQFVSDNIKNFNKRNIKSMVMGDSVTARYSEMLTDKNEYKDMDESVWEIDPTGSDIYAEIDDALKAVRSVTGTMDESYRLVCNELEKRGYAEWKYQDHMAAIRGNQQQIPGTENNHSLQLIMELLRKAQE